MFLLGVEIAAFLKLKEFEDFSELTFSSISLQLRRLELKPGALVVTGLVVRAMVTVSRGVSCCPSLLSCSLSFAERKIMVIQKVSQRAAQGGLGLEISQRAARSGFG